MRLKDKIISIIDELSRNQITVSDFCDMFYQYYDLGSTSDDFLDAERSILNKLSSVSSRYSKFEEERLRYKNVYTDEAEVLREALKALHVLKFD